MADQHRGTTEAMGLVHKPGVASIERPEPRKTRVAPSSKGLKARRGRQARDGKFGDAPKDLKEALAG